MKKTIPCENCGKDTIEVDERQGNIVVKSGFNGGKSPQWQSGHTEILTKKCTECGAKHGKKVKIDHTERIKRLKDAGLPMVIRTEHDRKE